MTTGRRSVPITEIDFTALQGLRDNARGWEYPRRGGSHFIPLFSPGQRAAVNLWGWVAMLMVPAGLAVPWFYGLWWLLLLPGALIVWRMNRRSAEQFFLENLQDSESFFLAVQASRIGPLVRVVLE